MTTQTKSPRRPPPTITLTPVAKSGSIKATGYDQASKTLAVQFKGGGKTYHYSGVPESVFGDMGKAESLGKFITGHVAGRYPHTCISKAD